MNDTNIKHKINSVTLTGNLTKDAFQTKKATMIRMALWNGKDKEGNDRPATFVDVMLVNCKDLKELIKGARVSINGRLANYKEKDAQWAKTGVIGYSLIVIKKDPPKESAESNKSDNLKDVPWEMDL